MPTALEFLSAAAHSAARFKTAPHGSGQTFSVFIERYDAKVDPEVITEFSNKIGFPVNVAEHPNGVLIDVNIGGFETRPSYQDVQSAADGTFLGGR